MVSETALEWLLEENQPSIRYLALKQLLHRRPDDPEVRATEELIPKKGWAARILARQKPWGGWGKEEDLYRPKYTSTNWMLLMLSDLGMTKDDARIARAGDMWIRRYSRADGGFDTEGADKSELCLVGNTARALVKFGYGDHPSVERAFQWLVDNQKENGGWSCFHDTGVIDAWEGMSAFSVYPRQKWTGAMKAAVDRGAEFYLKRKLHREGARYEPWYKFHYPNHYFYDLLVGLDFMTALGYGDDPRLGYALGLLEKKRRPDGRWNLDAVHPDVRGSSAKYYAKERPKPTALERVGQPSKMITLRAMTVLDRAGR